MAQISVGILTVSDTAFHSHPPSDRSGPALRALLTSLPASPYSVTASAVVPDDISEIRRLTLAFCGEGVDLVLTTGGTGFGVRDSTPEALAPLIDKPAPGLVTLMLTSSLLITPLAALARPVAGVHLSESSPSKGTLIISLPGSPKGATENLRALLGVLPHAVELARGGSGRKTHEEMQGGPRELASPTAGEALALAHKHHHHHHGHNHATPTPRSVLSQDPSISAAQRQRVSPYPLVPLRSALDLIFANTGTMPVDTVPFDEILVGHVLAEDVVAARDIPDTETTNVDGYALRSTDPEGVYSVLTTFPSSPIPPEAIYRINTGAPLPADCDAVIMVEDTVVVSTTANEENQVRTLAQVPKGENVRKKGSDVKMGERVLEKGDVVSRVGGELGTLAFVGKKSARVYRRPTVAVLSTGNELVNVLSPDSPPNPTSSFSSIPDSNRPSLLSLISHLGYNTVDLGIINDTMVETTKALKNGKERADVVITTGGTSMGVGDLLKPCIERELNGTVHFGRVAMKPGKPTTFATLPPHPIDPIQTPKLVFALPGNPASALVTFFVFVLPALRKLEGRREGEWELPRIPVQISTNVYLDPRPEYHRVWLRPNPSFSSSGASLIASSTGGQRSSRTVSLAVTNGLLELPALQEGEDGKIEKGSVVNCVVVGELGC